MTDTPARCFADVSDYQDVDLVAYKHAGHNIIGMKATEGVQFRCQTFVQRFKLARQLGLFIIVYHWLRQEWGGADQAEWLLQAIDDAGGMGDDVLIVCDVEAQPSTYVQWEAWGPQDRWKGFHDYIVKYTAKIPAIYGAAWFFDTYHVQHYAGVFWWGAAYPGPPEPTAWWPAYFAHQFSDNYPVPGVSTPCDYSRLSDWYISQRHVTPEAEVPTYSKFVIKRSWSPAAYLTDGLERRWLHDPQEFKDLIATGEVDPVIKEWTDAEVDAVVYIPGARPDPSPTSARPHNAKGK